MAFPLQYIRADRNGTKYFYDWTCPRCGGAGEAQKWAHTGRICYGCGGTGKRPRPLVVKEYTPEHAAKLEKKRIAREKKRDEDAKRYAEEHAEEIKAQNQLIIERRYAEFGCGKNGVGYVHEGNTWPVKDQIKKNGGKWVYGIWVCPIEIKGDGIKTKELNLNGHVGSGSVTWIDDFDLYEAVRG